MVSTICALTVDPIQYCTNDLRSMMDRYREDHTIIVAPTPTTVLLRVNWCFGHLTSTWVFYDPVLIYESSDSLGNLLVLTEIIMQA